MVVNRQVFEYQGRRLLEKVRIKTPFKYEALFEEEGCFLFFKESGSTIFSSETRFQLKEREAILLRCGTYFLEFLDQVNNGEIEVVAVHLYPDFLKKIYIKDLPTLIKKRHFSSRSQLLKSKKIISQFVKSFDLYFQNPILVTEEILELKIKEFILLLVQTKNVDSIVELISDLYSTKVTELKEVIESHLYSNLTIEELAKLSNLSLSSFKRSFKKEYDDSPKNYLVTKKIGKAKELLRLSKMPISEIAYEVGFNDPLYFSRIFKKKIGVTPTTFRQSIIHN